MNALQQRLADYQNGGTFPDYQELMALAEKLHDDPQPVKYVDVNEAIDLVSKYAKLMVEAKTSITHESMRSEAERFYKVEGELILKQIRTLLAPHELKRLSDEEVDNLGVWYLFEFGTRRSLDELIRLVEKKVRGEE